MGLCYYLYKPQKKERFYLDKGSWKQVDFSLQSYNLYRNILDNVGLDFDYKEEHNDKSLEYFSSLGSKITAWIGNDTITVISEDEFFDMISDIHSKTEIHNQKFVDKMYPITGTRLFPLKGNQL